MTRPGFDDRSAQAALAELPLGVGSIVAGKYRIDDVLGSGGMGVVVAATHVDLAHVIAIKLMRPTAARDKDLQARFMREARMTAQLRSQHVARVLDVGIDPTGVPYIAMEHLDGADLSRLLRQRGPLPVPLAADYILQALEGLAEAHRHGMVHRDIKPANLFLTETADGQHCVKVLDFGIAKGGQSSEAEGDGVTVTQAFMGSPLYMSPEQLRSARGVGPQSDVWSVGAVLHGLLTGRPPYELPSVAELCVAILASAPRKNMLELRPDLPPVLDRVVSRCLQTDLALRFPSVAELAEALAPFAGVDGPARAGRVRRMLTGASVTASTAPPDLMQSWRGPEPSQIPIASTVMLPAHASSSASAIASISSSAGNTHMSSAASSPPFPMPPRRSRGPWIVAIGFAAVALALGAILSGPMLYSRLHPPAASGEGTPPTAERSARPADPLATAATAAAESAGHATATAVADAAAPPSSAAGSVVNTASAPSTKATGKAAHPPATGGGKRPDDNSLPDFGSRK